MAAAPPQDFVCIITQRLMEDAVVDPEGNSYDKAAIEEWLAMNSTSPVTRNPLRPNQLAPNRVLRNMIAQWKADHLEAAEATGGAPRAGYTSPRPVPLEAPTLPPVQNVTMTATQVGTSLKVSLQPPAGRRGDEARRGPASVVCSIDISGSMAATTSVKDANGKEESNGLTQLDLVKHAVRTIIHCLDDTDYLALVKYNDGASIALPLTQMTGANKKKALEVLDNFASGSLTNIWDGLYKAMECLRTASTTPPNPCVMLFTDGQPTVTPPRGHLEMLKRYRDEHSVLPGVVHTYGFGYSLDTKLLEDLATEGGGAYNFIPDASLVGTIFVNSLSNHLARCGDNVVLKVEDATGFLAEEGAVVGGVEHIAASWGKCVQLRSVHYGQRRDVVFTLKDSAPVDPAQVLTASYRNFENGENVDVALAPSELAEDAEATEVEANRLRLAAADAIRDICVSMKAGQHGEAKAGLARIVAEIHASPAKDFVRVKDLCVDLEGQVGEAVVPAAYEKWGKHYLPSLRMAHLCQVANNFKDPGVQHYGGKLFEKVRDKCDDVFVKLPPPKPTGRTPTHARGAAARPVNMANYYNRGGGCFSGHSKVILPGGATKCVREVAPGDAVMTRGGAFAAVRCVVRTAVDGPLQMVCLPSGVRLTPYHPIYQAEEQRWAFPCEVGKPQAVTAADLGEAFIYDFVLAEGHTVMVDGVPCVTLGHGLTEDDVVAHEYFGTQRVVDDLATLPGWAEGTVTLAANGRSFVRDPATNLVAGLAGSAAP
eukprot:TRINITY_DN32024_c0_g1_i1.p1 TRINITY_DN32024_c0_g1~~TRINITY_DN32024_c0_g1_i1.p1  ORF type:complete len:767 (+),score=281.16 TRINITY_DN32024_c0_g1_i1:65-2365(+)